MSQASFNRGNVALVTSWGDGRAWYNYRCAHCNKDATGAVVAAYEGLEGPIKWLLCNNCGNGSVRTREGVVYPPASTLPDIQGLPSNVVSAYREARDCFSFNAFTACELICRKILMHVGVDKGAKEGEDFTVYVDHLTKKGYVTSAMTGWVDLIRKNGNKSTHKLENPDRTRAENTLMFTSQLLRLVYEMEYLSSKFAPQSQAGSTGSP